MSISILRDGRLWGLISCHHGTPAVRPVPGPHGLRPPGPGALAAARGQGAPRRTEAACELKSLQAGLLAADGRRGATSSTAWATPPGRAAGVRRRRGGRRSSSTTSARSSARRRREAQVRRLVDWLGASAEDVYSTDRSPAASPRPRRTRTGRAGCWRSRSRSSTAATSSGSGPRWCGRSSGPATRASRRAGSATRCGSIRGSRFEVWKRDGASAIAPLAAGEVEAAARAPQRDRRHRAAQGRGAGRAERRSWRGATRSWRRSPTRSRTTCGRRCGTSSATPSCCASEPGDARRDGRRYVDTIIESAQLRRARWSTTCWPSRGWAGRGSSSDPST